MKSNINHPSLKIKKLLFLSLLIAVASCKPKVNNSVQIDRINSDTIKIQKKPPSSYPDTVFINVKSSVFYSPDSAQLESIKSVTDSQIFNGIQHDYYYQFRNAKKVLNSDWSQIKIIEVSDKRFISFIKDDKSNYTVDLNEYGDAYGLFVFNLIDNPVLVDMTNINDALYSYFSK